MEPPANFALKCVARQTGPAGRTVRTYVQLSYIKSIYGCGEEEGQAEDKRFQACRQTSTSPFSDAEPQQQSKVEGASYCPLAELGKLLKLQEAPLRKGEAASAPDLAGTKNAQCCYEPLALAQKRFGEHAPSGAFT